MTNNKELPGSQAVKSFHKDFIFVWDNVLPIDYCNWLIKQVDQTNQFYGRSKDYVQDKQLLLGSFFREEEEYLYHGINKCVREYANAFPYLQYTDLFSGLALVQKTEPKEGYHTFHSENHDWDTQQRVLAWMVYLNDIDDGGETEFLYQQVKVKPKAGRVVIWPGGFTHLHRGNPPMSNKYIATGWYAGAGCMNKRRVAL
tara:strand:+ start:458 stop:1057 length:600 start_codon:yes stop_codon:yes gene_type:complete